MIAHNVTELLWVSFTAFAAGVGWLLAAWAMRKVLR